MNDVLLNRMEATNFTVIVANEEQVEISFTRMWNFSLEGKLAPLNIDKRFFNLPTVFVFQGQLQK